MVQAVTLVLVLTSRHYSGQRLAVVVVILLLVLVAVESAVIAGFVLTTRRRVANNAVASRRWQWQNSLFLGPYDEEAGVRGSHAMYEVYQNRRRAPLVTLMLLDGGFGWTSNAFMSATGGRSVVCALSKVDHIDLVAGTAPTSWWTAIHPKEGWRTGQLRIVRKDGTEALFTGVRLDHLVDRLLMHGGQLHTGPGVIATDPRSGSLG
ncbi:MAG TPA: hypothetical protein VG650_14995 [Mycobacteriales bacterium]|nr:hypothetical protein [Mycobacteriales bacterium]